MPVQPGVLDVLGIGLLESPHQPFLDREEEDDHPDDDVDGVEAGDREVATGEEVAVGDVVGGVVFLVE